MTSEVTTRSPGVPPAPATTPGSSPVGPPATVPRDTPRLLTALLERRYLAELQPERWRMTTEGDDGAAPVVCEVEGVGRDAPAGGNDWHRLIPHVLASHHEPGHATVLIVHGNERRHRLLLGGRRIPGRARGSTADFLSAQSGAWTSHVPGLTLGAPHRLDDRAHDDLAGFLHAAPATAVVTGVPSLRAGAGPGPFQNIERVTAAAGDGRYALMVLAEPLDATELDDTIDRARRLRSEVHRWVRRSETQSEGETTTTSQSRQAPREGDHTLAIAGVAAFCAVAGIVTGVGALAQLVSPMMVGAGLLRASQTPGSQSDGESSSHGRATTVDVLDANAEASEQLLARHIERLEVARSSGWWRTSVFVAAADDATLAAVTGALRGMGAGETATPDPVRVVRPASHLVRGAMVRGQSITLRPSAEDLGHPLGGPFDSMATCMSSEELAVLISMPRRELPGIPVRDDVPFGLSVPDAGPASVRLGTVLDQRGRPVTPLHLDAAALNRHVFITGMTGYGKTTTAKRLLLEARARLEVPFLVIEPVKAEYRSLASHPELGGRLNVWSIGEEVGARPLRLNPMRPVDGVPLLRHIDLLKSVFTASFAMFAGMPQVLEDALLEVYTDRGWDLETSENDHVRPGAPEDERCLVLPCLEDLHDKVEEVLARKHYGREVEQNLGAALRSRLGGLMVGAKGATLNTRRGLAPRRLFAEPGVVELRNLGDDEEKAFVMALLLGTLYEWAEHRAERAAPGSGGLRHLTLVEEAHRLLRAPRSGGAPESADPQAKAVGMFTDLLAEMRAYGEGFIVADQIPSKLAPETLKNSNVKILHRLAAPDDRSVAGRSINLDDAQTRHLATLGPGTAVVHDDRLGSAVLVGMSPPEEHPAPVPVRGKPDQGEDLGYLHRTTACRRCPAPCTLRREARRLGEAGLVDPELARVHEQLLYDAPEQAWTTWRTWREQQPDASSGALYCATSQSAHRWLARALAARASATHDRRRAVEHRVAAVVPERALARLWARWTVDDSFDEPAQEVAKAARTELAAALVQAPPRGTPGCPTCPAPCAALPLVAPLARDLGSVVAERARSSMAADSRLRGIERAAEPLLGRGSGVAGGPDHDALCHCLIAVTMAGEKAAGRSLVELDEVLEHLRTRTTGSAADPPV